MLDLKLIRDNPEVVIEALEKRGGEFREVIESLQKLDVLRREKITDVEQNKALRNDLSKQIGVAKREKKDASSIMAEVAQLGEAIKTTDEALRAIESEINASLLAIPNMPADDTPLGKDESENVCIKTWGTLPSYDFHVKDHIELSANLDILDFERAAKITGSRFVVYKGLGARLERALMQFMMDLHSEEHGYTEYLMPYIVNHASMTAAGQFPKFKDEAFALKNGNDWYLNPTAEVPSINYYRDEILMIDQLPQKFVAFTTAFRSEAGAAGKDTRGILRQHQFNKVELIKFCTPETSQAEHDAMLLDSEKVLKLLKLPYQVVTLCTGDLGFAMAKTYDIEVWLPGQNRYREIGSISNAYDYQARRANIRYKKDSQSKTEFLHTLNGSGLAIGRTVIAILENYQNKDGSITIPDVLVPYMKVKRIGE